MKHKTLVVSGILLASIIVGGHTAKANSPDEGGRLSVSNFEQLRSALSEDNDITSITFANDIQLTDGIRINPNKKAVEIDGQGYTLRENPNWVGSSTANIYISDENGTKDITLKNANIEGRDYYGPITIGTNDVTYNVENVTYTGPQFVYNPQGYVNFRGTNQFTVQSSAETAEMQEFAEVSGVTIDGNFRLNYNSTGGYSAFGFDHNASKVPTFNVRPSARVDIDAPARSLFYSGQKTNFTFGEGSRFNSYSVQPLFDQGWIGNMTVNSGAQVNFHRSGRNWLDYPTLRVDGQLKVAEGAVFGVLNAPETDAVALYSANGSYIDFDNPSLVELYTHANAKAVNLNGTTFAFNSPRVSEWIMNETDNPTVSITTPLDAILSVNGTNKQVIYSNQPDAFNSLSIVNGNRLTFSSIQ